MAKIVASMLLCDLAFTLQHLEVLYFIARLAQAETARNTQNSPSYQVYSINNDMNFCKLQVYKLQFYKLYCLQ